jgi:hypothetical protein
VIKSPTGQCGDTVLLFYEKLLSSFFVVGQNPKFAGCYCQCLVCADTPCTKCKITTSQPHSKCYICLWVARGRDCTAATPCHGCKKYLAQDPSWRSTLVRLAKDRRILRTKRGSYTPATISAQSDSDGEFVSVAGADVPDVSPEIENFDSDTCDSDHNTEG